MYEGSRIKRYGNVSSSDEADASPDQTATPVVHASGSALRPITLHARKGILDMLRSEGRSGFGGLNEQRAHGKGRLDVVRGVFTTAFVARVHSRIELAFAKEGRSHVVLQKVRLLERLFDVERRDRQRANHLEGKEADDIGGIVVRFQVEVRRQIEELPESLGCGCDFSIRSVPRQSMIIKP